MAKFEVFEIIIWIKYQKMFATLFLGIKNLEILSLVILDRKLLKSIFNIVAKLDVSQKG